MLDAFQSLVMLVLAVTFFGVKVFALIDCLRHRPDAFPAADKRTKNFWLLLTGLSAFTAVVASPLGIFGFAGLVASLVYLVDVRPRLAEVEGWRR